MKEIEVIVSDDKLAVQWFEQALYSVDNLKDIIEFSNYRYGFNLYDNNEELSEERLKYKMAIKYKNICVPLMSAIEEALKSVIIARSYANDPTKFNRDEIVFNLMKEVRKEEKTNGHDIFALMNYINRHYNNNFITAIADEYAFIRDHKTFFNNHLSPRSTLTFNTTEERIVAATREYTQGFIEFRYLYEKGDSYVRNVDLTKIIQYSEAILEVVKQQVLGFADLSISAQDMVDRIPKNDFGTEMIDDKLEREKRERLVEIQKKGFLPVNDEYSGNIHYFGVVYLPQEDLEKKPRSFIIGECIPACVDLWQKNIFTCGTSNYSDDGGCWIDIAEEALSEENKEIFTTILGCERHKWFGNGNDEYFYRLKSNNVGEKGQAELFHLAQQFQMQDVKENISFVSMQKFLIDYCDCYDEVPNPNYKKIELSERIRLLFDSGILEEQPMYLKQFNPNKITKPVEELASDHNMVIDGERVYLSPFHYQKHKNFVDSFNRTSDSPKTVK